MSASLGIVDDYARTLWDVSVGLCGFPMPTELALAILLRFRGLQHPLACSFLGGLAQRRERFTRWTSGPMATQPWCACGENGYINNLAHLFGHDVLPFHQLRLTRQVCSHTIWYRPTVPGQLVNHKLYAPHRCYGIRSKCRNAALWLRVLRSPSRESAGAEGTVETFPRGLSVLQFLRAATRAQVRDAIATANGTPSLTIADNDYTSRGEWVRVYYNSLREEPAKAWPYAG